MWMNNITHQRCLVCRGSGEVLPTLNETDLDAILLDKQQMNKKIEEVEHADKIRAENGDSERLIKEKCLQCGGAGVHILMPLDEFLRIVNKNKIFKNEFN